MQDKVIEILGHLLRRFQEEEGTGVLDSTTRWLRESGYTSSEISVALSLFCKKFQDFKREKSDWKARSTPAIRVMSPFEKEVFTPEAFGYLVQLEQLGIITINDMESIVERAIMFGGMRVDREEIQAIAASVIFFKDDLSSPLIKWDEDDTRYH